MRNPTQLGDPYTNHLFNQVQDGNTELHAARKRISDMERALKSIVDMIDNCADVPRDPTSLPMMIRRTAERAAKYQRPV